MKWGGADGGVGPDRTHLGGAAGRWPRPGAGGDRLQAAIGLSRRIPGVLTTTRGAHWQLARKFPARHAALGAAGAARSLRRAGRGAEVARRPGEAGEVRSERARDGRGSGASACGNPALVGAAGSPLRPRLQMKQRPEAAAEKRYDRSGRAGASPPRKSTWGAQVPPAGPAVQGAGRLALSLCTLR